MINKILEKENHWTEDLRQQPRSEDAPMMWLSWTHLLYKPTTDPAACLGAHDCRHRFIIWESLEEISSAGICIPWPCIISLLCVSQEHLCGVLLATANANNLLCQWSQFQNKYFIHIFRMGKIGRRAWEFSGGTLALGLRHGLGIHSQTKCPVGSCIIATKQTYSHILQMILPLHREEVSASSFNARIMNNTGTMSPSIRGSRCVPKFSLVLSQGLHNNSHFLTCRPPWPY